MLTRIRRLPSPALVIAAIALIVAVGGGTFALAVSKNQTKKIAKKVANKRINKRAPKLSVLHAQTADTANTATSADSVAPNGVDTDAIQDNAVTTPKIADNAVSTAKIADGIVTNPKIADAAVSNSKIADAAVSNSKIADAAVSNSKIAGDAITTDKIAAGQVHGSDVGPTIVRAGTAQTVATGDSAIVVAQCAGGEPLLGGGAVWDNPLTGNKGLQATFPSGSAWVAIGKNQSGSNQTLRSFALCLQG